MRKLFVGIAALSVVAVGVGPAWGQELAFMASLLTMHAPSAPFDPAKAPPAPDYAQQSSWGALPTITNASDVSPPGIDMADGAHARGDVFFIHPTTYFSSTLWNQPLDDQATNQRTDSGPLRAQASAFNGCCRVYAPRYRQMTFGGFVEYSENSDRALDLAYSDVKRAFEYYVAHDNNGRPIIIASHSQGSRIAQRLLADEFDGKPLQHQFVAAYVVGTWMPESWFVARKTIKPCETATDTGCVLTWSTLGEGADRQKQRDAFARRSGLPASSADKTFVCTNPLSWSRGPGTAPASENLGAWVPGRGQTLRAIQPGLVSARCENGALVISNPDDRAFHIVEFPGENYHNYDYQLFYMNVRKNASDRLAAFLAAKR
jgi:hypothetical protein